MLKRLEINNLAIIENIGIDFKDGLSVLTGETGAGKSLIIDSLGLLLGDRAAVELIRNGESKANIKGFFVSNNIHLSSLLNKLNIPVINDEIVVERIISINKSTIKVNNVVVTLSDLKRIAKYLADIHMQFDNEKILNPDNYLEIIDGFKYELISSYKKDYLTLLDIFNEKKNNLLSLIKKQNDVNERKDIYEYQLKELSALELEIGEEEKIDNEISLLTHFDKIYSLLGEIDNIARGDTLDKLYELKSNVDKLQEYQPSYQDINEKLNDHYYELEDIFDTLKKDFKNLDYDPNRLEILEERKHALNSVKKKYKKDIKELIEYQKELNELLSSSNNYEELINEAKIELKEAYINTYHKGQELSNIRIEIAKYMEKELEKNMLDLSLKAVFKVDIASNPIEEDYAGNSLTLNGIDNINFLIETNIGEGLKPLSKIISGGEASRIMLAIKALFIKSQKISTVIFDEIDTGISGEIAQKVAEKIYEIALNTQVIVITHMPQVAAIANNHIKISKSIKNGRTYTSCKELNLDEKIYEIAYMISGGKVSKTQLEYAKEMLYNR